MYKETFGDLRRRRSPREAERKDSAVVVVVVVVAEVVAVVVVVVVVYCSRVSCIPSCRFIVWYSMSQHTINHFMLRDIIT